MNFSFSPTALIMAQNKYLTAAEQFRQTEFSMDIEKTFGKHRKQSPSHAMFANEHAPLSQKTSSTLRHSTVLKHNA